MLPPPVPKAKLAAAASSSTPAEAPKRINLSSGMVTGKAKGNFSFGNGNKPTLPSNKSRIFGVGALSGAGQKGRVVHRVSKMSSLPMVEGSPVKGGEGMKEEPDADGMVAGSSKVATDEEMKEMTNDMGMFLAGSPPAGAATNTPGSSQDYAIPVASGSGELPSGSESGKDADPKVATNSWQSNASRRASMASQFLSQSLSSLPQTPPRPVAPTSEGKGKTRAGLRSSSSSYPSSAQAKGMQTAPGALGSKTSPDGNAGGAHVSKSKNGGGPSAPGPTAGSLRVLKDCTIFVDVRTDDGDDAGGLFVDMLRGMGAKVRVAYLRYEWKLTPFVCLQMLGKVGQTCTHIVYKNGLMSTLTRYRYASAFLSARFTIHFVVQQDCYANPDP